jgi:hypothetical protein
MAAAYPTSNPSFSTKATNDVIAASHINGLQDEVIALGTALRVSLQHNLLFTDATFDIGASGATRPRDLFLSRNLAIGGTLNLTGVATLGGLINASAQPRCIATELAAVQSISNATFTAITFTTDDVDVGALHDTSSNTSRFTIPAGGDGLYLIVGKVAFTTNATGERLVRIRLNGATTLKEIGHSAVAATSREHVEISVLKVLAAADYIELMAYQASGGNLNTGGVSRGDANELFLVKLW